MTRIHRLFGFAVALACTPDICATEPEPALVTPLTPAQAVGVDPLAAPPPGLAPVPRTTPLPDSAVGAGTPLPESDPILNPRPRRFELLPASLLWEPLLAVKRDPRTGFTFSDADSKFGRQTADPSIGTTFGLFRYNRDGSPVEWQFDLFSVVHSRFSSGDYLVNTDYRAGALTTARAGNWAAKFGWEHTSTHIGDEALVYGKGKFIGYERDEAVLGLNYLYANQLRVYGQVAWSFWRRIGDLAGDTRPTPWRYDVGFDWYRRTSTTRLGQPFAALNVGFDGATNNDASLVAQVGWMWKLADRRLSQFRVYAEFADGRSPFGQTYLDRERYAGVGFALDY